jgi:hypothetical protein
MAVHCRHPAERAFTGAGAHGVFECPGIDRSQGCETQVYVRRFLQKREAGAGGYILHGSPAVSAQEGTLGKVSSKPSVTPHGVISIQGSTTINGNQTAVVETNSPLNITGIPSQPSSSPIVLSIDGQVVAKADANSKVITYYEKAQQWGQGMHDVELISETQKGPQYLATSLA